MNENTFIHNISLKDFLSHISEYLADKVISLSKSANNKFKKITVTSGIQITGNDDIPGSLLTHDHQEADTLLVMHALFSGKRSF